MPMTILVTRNAPYRYRGFLTSCMLEIAPGIYTSPRMSKGVRERVWDVCVEWADALPADGGVLLTWRDPGQPSGQAIRVLGWAKSDIVDYDGFWIARRAVGSPNTASDTPNVDS